MALVMPGMLKKFDSRTYFGRKVFSYNNKLFDENLKVGKVGGYQKRDLIIFCGEWFKTA